MDAVIDIVGINEGSRSRNCKWHEVCGTVLEMDSVVRFHKVQVDTERGETTAVAAVWVTDGVER
eukprot:scaffold15752_cov116-Amphora_coffeaeformis.AAC.1